MVPNVKKKHRNVLPSKLRPVNPFKKYQNFIFVFIITQTLCIIEKKIPGIKTIFFTIYVCVTNFRALCSIFFFQNRLGSPTFQRVEDGESGWWVNSAMGPCPSPWKPT